MKHRAVAINHENWGWKSENGKFSPVMTDMEPPELLNVVRCKCNKKLSYRKETVRLLHNIEITNQDLTLKPYSADRPISIKSRS